VQSRERERERRERERRAEQKERKREKYNPKLFVQSIMPKIPLEEWNAIYLYDTFTQKTSTKKGKICKLHFLEDFFWLKIDFCSSL
jgi:hypothetical protein